MSAFRVQFESSISKNEGVTCERIELRFFLRPLHFSHVFCFPLLVTHTMDDHRQKILVVLILTMPMHQVVSSSFFLFGLLCFLKLYHFIQVLDLEKKSPFKNSIKTKQAEL
jgi:hypothetical protein